MLTKEQKALVISRIKQGHRTNLIAKQLGLTKSYVDMAYFEYIGQPVKIEALASQAIGNDLRQFAEGTHPDLTDSSSNDKI